MANNTKSLSTLAQLPSDHVPVVMNEVLQKHKKEMNNLQTLHFAEMEKLKRQHRDSLVWHKDHYLQEAVARCAAMQYGEEPVMAKEFIRQYVDTYEEGNIAHTLLAYVMILEALNE